MKANARYTVAIHILALLATCKKETATSEYIAGSINTNPVVVRRALKELIAAGFAASVAGAYGGYRLAKQASEISLWDIYLATKDDTLFAMHAHTPNPLCPVGANIQTYLDEVYSRAELSMQGVLQAITIQVVCDAVCVKS